MKIYKGKLINIQQKTIDRQRAEYLKYWAEMEANNLVKSRVDGKGKIYYEAKLSEKAFENNMLRAIANDPEVNRYTFGRDMAQSQAAYTDKQLHYFRTEVLLNLDKIKPQAKEEIIKIMKQNQTTKSWWSYTDFKRNAAEIMDIYFIVGDGKKYLTDT